MNETRGLSNIGSILTGQYQYYEALQILEQALPLVRDLGQQVDEGITFGHLSDVMELLGRYDQAHEYRMKARDILHQADDPQEDAEMLASLCRIDGFRGKFDSVEEIAWQAISIAQKQGYLVEEAATWEALGFSG